MVEQIEIKRKFFEVVEVLGPRSKKVTRKGKEYFLKDFSGDQKGFERYTESAHRLSVSGVTAPKVYVYDKKTLLLAEEFIPGPTVLDVLLEKDLPEEYFPPIFATNWYMKNEGVLLSFDPQFYKFYKGKMYYLPQIYDKFDEKKTFEKVGIWYWFYCREFVKYLEVNKLPIDHKRADVDQSAINKQIALTVVKFYR